MKSHPTSLSSAVVAEMQNVNDRRETPLPLHNTGGGTTPPSHFWSDRLFEGGLIISLALYYIFCNPSLPIGLFPHANPLFALPFLVLFAIFCWYRLPFAIALLPLTLPYYFYQKPIIGSSRFSLVEITLGICVLVALLRHLFIHQERRLSWTRLRNLLGPFLLPILVFLLVAGLSITIAYAQKPALRTFREEVLDPLLYVVLALSYLRTRQDLQRLLVALLGTGMVIALLGIGQMLFFQNTLVKEADGIRRVHTVYGSANSIGLLFDYVIPLALALLMARISWRVRLVVLALCVPLFYTLYLSNSRGAWIAVPVAAIFIVAFAMRNRKVLLISGSILAVVLVISAFVFQTQISEFVNGHTNAKGISSLAKRPYIWQSALNMIHDSPWLGYGLDNWLCHYSPNKVCKNNLHKYWIVRDPVTHASTGLADEPNISHPHNVFLHVWVSMGVFGLLAFGVVLILFFWLFARIIKQLARSQLADSPHLRWMAVGLAGAMLAAMLQGQIDSAFLEQDLAFCFWMLVTALLLLRDLSGTTWRDASGRPLDRRQVGLVKATE
ncbi:MAG: O-antigen ligase family protein [Ktedonobacteraceae bacterium]|nr:O-antigen ligase family protein [Ktedonobacteraceae bacterium]